MSGSVYKPSKRAFQTKEENMRIRRSGLRRGGILALLGLVLWFVPLVASAQSTCTGDCDGSGMVAINELILCVNVALGSSQLNTCEACDANGDGMVSINELIGAVNNALQSCTVGPTPTPTTSNCPLEKGHYTIT